MGGGLGIKTPRQVLPTPDRATDPTKTAKGHTAIISHFFPAYKRKIGQAYYIGFGQEVFTVETSVIHTTEVIGGKEYPLTITRQKGLQEIEVDGAMIQVVAVTVFDSPLGRSRCYTRAQPDATPEERAANRRRIQEVATQAMIDQGIW